MALVDVDLRPSQSSGVMADSIQTGIGTDGLRILVDSSITDVLCYYAAGSGTTSGHSTTKSGGDATAGNGLEVKHQQLTTIYVRPARVGNIPTYVYVYPAVAGSSFKLTPR